MLSSYFHRFAHYPFARRNTNILNPGQEFKADVITYDIYGKTATAKVVTNKFKFIDYLHLGRIDGEWRIVNVLWEFLQ
ncbi:MAG: nuclear transport factor 2 family protein [Ignavibacteria bacterium]|nr:MAG: nuclear transport factor 2 family protein [Ignavibacteria bacterium]